MTASNTKSFKSFQAPINPLDNIYELVTQEIDVPQGLLYRGKYCGKSKLRTKTNEFGMPINRPQSSMLT